MSFAPKVWKLLNFVLREDGVLKKDVCLVTSPCVMELWVGLNRIQTYESECRD